MPSAITFGRYDVLIVILCYAVYIGALTWIGREMQLGPWFYVGLSVASLIALWHYVLIRNRDRDRCFRAFLGNHWLGLAVFAGVVTDFWLRLGRLPQWPR